MKSETTFSIADNTYFAYPTLDQFISEAGIENANRKQTILGLFDKEGIRDVSQLYSFAIRDLIEIGIIKKYAMILTKHLQLLRRRSSLILQGEELFNLYKRYQYLNTGNTELQQVLTHANGKMGLRTETLVEFYGAAGTGKTQLLMTLAVMSMIETSWRRPVLFVDTEGSFDINRLYQIAEFHGVPHDTVNKYINVAKAYNFDDVDTILNEIAIDLRERDLGLIIIDSIIDPLKAQYPLDDDFSNLQERQQHLKQVTDKLKSIAQLHNLVAIISNQVRASMDGTSEIVPQGGNVLSHSTDMRFWVKDIEESNVEWIENRVVIENAGIQLSTIELVDCGFLPIGTADILIGSFGTADPNMYKKLIKYEESNNHKQDYSDQDPSDDEKDILKHLFYE